MFRAQRSLAGEYERYKTTARTLHAVGTQWITTMAAGDTSIPQIIDELLPMLQVASALYATSPDGLAQYARDQEDDQTYDVVGEFVTLRAALDAVIANIGTTMPKDGSDRTQERTISDAGVVVSLVVTPAQTSTLRGLLATMVAAIDL